MTLFELICAGNGRTFERPRRRNRRGDFGRNADCLESRQLMTFVTSGGFETEPNDSLAAADIVSVVSTNRELTSRFQGVCCCPLSHDEPYRMQVTCGRTPVGTDFGSNRSMALRLVSGIARFAKESADLRYEGSLIPQLPRTASVGEPPKPGPFNEEASSAEKANEA